MAKYRDMDLVALKKEAKSTKTSAAKLLELAKHPEPSIQLIVANNPSAPLAALEYLSRHGKWNILKAVAKNPGTPIVVLEKLAIHKQPTVRKVVASSSRLSRVQVESLASDLDGGVITELIRHHAKDIPAHFFEQYCQHDDQRTRQVAYNYGVYNKFFTQEFKENLVLQGLVEPDQKIFQEGSPELFEAFTTQSFEQIRLWMAFSRKAPAQILSQLSTDDSWDVRREVASNHATPPEILAILAQDPIREVRQRLVANSKLPREILMILARDQEPEVRYWVIEHYNTDTAMLELLAQDSSEKVRNAARQRLE
jgi:hypothetical protein